MSKTKKIVAAKENKDRNISYVRFEGNTKFTNVEKAIEMAEKGQIKNAHSVHRSDGSKYLRTNPDRRKDNNLDELARSS